MTNPNHQRFLQLHLSFNCGADTITVQSPLAYSGTEWHTVTLVRSGASGKLSVDNELVGEATGSCHAPAALAPPFYYGGLRNLTSDIRTNLEVSFAVASRIELRHRDVLFRIKIIYVIR